MIEPHVKGGIMKRLMIAVFAMATMGSIGCGGGGSDHVSKAKSLADKACACKGDEKCLEEAEKAWQAWETEARKGKKPDDATMAKIKEQEDRAEKCAEGGGE
jgi:hypothetical protein